ncbi:DNA-dependent metalloprotease WSS1 [Pistacia vera]|uniref:DNA-dependent metalloprotease WSS1 n=1 Tax=Pistacia vera TaxID=55513 RepID=UPI0012630472|nr:DNA-dependent metalloprotease WSS1 [Pistacia vera]XP_031258951.1 DNA-dependent metalloprotease WSS1 [Pistacia vera]
MNLGDLHKVWEIKTLKRKPGEEEAKKILERIAKQVQPIMRKHKWRVKVLSEFCPTNPCLLGVNVGCGFNVKLRLRRPNRDLDFIPFEQVLDTMLHELCHNVHGPHNANFYKLWDELRKECEELISKGISGTGEGFDLPGRRLGGFSRQPPLSSLRQTALTAAEKRARLGSLLPSGPRRLGGDSSIMADLSPIQAAAMAAERRLQDDIWCGSQSSGDVESSSDISEDIVYMGQSTGNTKNSSGSSGLAVDAVSRKRSRESNSKFVDQSSDTSRSMLNHDARSPKVCRSENTSASQSNCNSNSGFVELSSASTPASMQNWEAAGSLEETALWECEACTLLNPPLAPICEVCTTARPRGFGTENKTWSCKFCTLENSLTLDRCSACDKWRYSHGASMATPAPYLGT